MRVLDSLGSRLHRRPACTHWWLQHRIAGVALRTGCLIPWIRQRLWSAAWPHGNGNLVMEVDPIHCLPVLAEWPHRLVPHGPHGHGLHGLHGRQNKRQAGQQTAFDARRRSCPKISSRAVLRRPQSHTPGPTLMCHRIRAASGHTPKPGTGALLHFCSNPFAASTTSLSRLAALRLLTGYWPTMSRRHALPDPIIRSRIRRMKSFRLRNSTLAA